jgi:hypothetical protein
MIAKTNKLIHLVGNCKIFFSYIENYYVKKMQGNSFVFMFKAFKKGGPQIGYLWLKTARSN